MDSKMMITIRKRENFENNLLFLLKIMVLSLVFLSLFEILCFSYAGKERKNIIFCFCFGEW